MAAFGSHCDRPEYWPWIFAFEAQSLKISTFWTTPSFICEPLPSVPYGLHCYLLCFPASTCLAQAFPIIVCQSCCIQHLAAMHDTALTGMRHLCSTLDTPQSYLPGGNAVVLSQETHLYALHCWHFLRHMLHAARFNQTNPAFGPVFGGGPTIWMGGTAPSFYKDHLYIVTGRQPCLSSHLLML